MGLDDEGIFRNVRVTRTWVVGLLCVSALSFWGAYCTGEVGKVMKTEEEWHKQLTPEQFRILRQKGTERAFSGDYWKTKEKGVYRCAGCGNELFGSDAKFDSGTGWPSFWEPVSTEKIQTHEDRSWFTTRTEVLCARCGGHLGHVFEDGPPPTGLRYCINSGALKFEKKEGGL